MSNINFLGIDENFPIPGTDNPSEGFRTNFSVVKNSLREAKTEIENLQSNTAKLNTSNNFSGNSIVNVKLVRSTMNVFDGGALGADSDLNFSNGFYQQFLINSSLNLALMNFPTDSYGVVRLSLTGNNNTVSFSAAGVEVFYDLGFPNQLVVGSTPTVIEIWRKDLDSFFIKYLGQFNIDRYNDVDVKNIVSIENAENIVEHDYRFGSVFYHTTPTENFGVNLTNLFVPDNSSITVQIIIEQNTIPQFPTEIQFSGVAQNILWQNFSDSATTPVGTANSNNIVTLTILRFGDLYKIYGKVEAFG